MFVVVSFNLPVSSFLRNTSNLEKLLFPSHLMRSTTSQVVRPSSAILFVVLVPFHLSIVPEK